MEKRVSKLIILLTVFITITGFFLSTEANAAYLDDFEDGDHDGWSVTVTGNGLGSTGVETHNGGLMAFARDTGSGSYSLNHDFNYMSDHEVFFRMHAIASAHTCNPGSGCSALDAESGVEVTFLSSLNSALGSISISYATDPNWLSGSDIAVDSNQHDYQATMSEFAGLAGLDSTDPIAKMQLSFFAKGETFGNVSGVAHSSSVVWFDDVSVTPVPLPAAAWMLAPCLGAIGFIRSRTRRFAL